MLSMELQESQRCWLVQTVVGFFDRSSGLRMTGGNLYGHTQKVKLTHYLSLLPWVVKHFPTIFWTYTALSAFCCVDR